MAPTAPTAGADSWLSPRVGYGLVIAFYVLSFPYHPGLRSPNELCRLWQSRSLVDHGTLNINATLQEAGSVGDLSCVAVYDVGGKQELHRCFNDAGAGPMVAKWYYPSKAPLTSFLGAPVYWLLERFTKNVTDVTQVYFSRLVVTVLPTLLMLWMLRRFLGAFMTERTADLLTITYAMGTMALSYSEAFMSHQLTAVLLFCSFYAAWRTERTQWGWWGWLLAGASAGAVVTGEYTGALGVVCVAAYVVAKLWKRWKSLGVAVALVVVGAAPLLGALMAYHQACFGDPLVSGYKFLNDPGYQHWHLGGFLGIKAPVKEWFALSFFSPLRGLFALSPFLLLTFGGQRVLWTTHRAYFVFMLVLLGTHTYFTSSFDYTSWGWTTGPRHLTGMLPFLLVPIGLTLESALAREPSTGAPSTGLRAKWRALGAMIAALLRQKPEVLWVSIGAGLCVSSVLATGLVSFVNYVPDDVSTSLWGLAVPMLIDGFCPVSALGVILPNPAAGFFLVVMLLGVTVWLALRFKELQASAFIIVAVIVVHFGVLRAFTRNDSGDEHARQFLKSIWLAPSGSKVPLFGASTKPDPAERFAANTRAEHPSALPRSVSQNRIRW